MAHGPWPAPRGPREAPRMFRKLPRWAQDGPKTVKLRACVVKLRAFVVKLRAFVVTLRALVVRHCQDTAHCTSPKEDIGWSAGAPSDQSERGPRLVSEGTRRAGPSRGGPE